MRYEQTQKHNNLAVLKTTFCFFVGPLPRGVPGEGPDCHFLKDSRFFADPGPNPGGQYIFDFHFGLKRSWDSNKT